MAFFYLAEGTHPEGTISAMTKFEYKVVSVNQIFAEHASVENVENAIKDFGNEGFDLVAVVPVPGETSGGPFPP
jgi:uncharacterized protein DUF4177